MKEVEMQTNMRADEKTNSARYAKKNTEQKYIKLKGPNDFRSNRTRI